MLTTRLVEANDLVAIAETPVFSSDSATVGPRDLQLDYVAFRGIRSNTLYFDAQLHNTLHNELIYGRFALFYRTEKMGRLYGYFTDSVKTLP